jgi:hypothetical protein
MDDKSKKENRNQAELLLALPDSIFNDLSKIASFNDVSIEDLTYSYIVDGIAGDSCIVKRVEFKQHVSKSLDKDDFHSRPSRDIVSDFNLLY